MLSVQSQSELPVRKDLQEVFFTSQNPWYKRNCRVQEYKTAAKYPVIDCHSLCLMQCTRPIKRKSHDGGWKGGGEGYPMTAIETPGRWPVLVRIWSVTSCRSKSVRPQLGQLTYSVLVFLILEPAHQLGGSQVGIVAWFIAGRLKYNII